MGKGDGVELDRLKTCSLSDQDVECSGVYDMRELGMWKYQGEGGFLGILVLHSLSFVTR